MPEQVVLKKYANRRLYDTSASAYVTLTQVADIIKGGKTVKIVDAKTGDDVTAFILTQIVVEEARLDKILLPVPFLHLIIQYGDNILKEFFEKYLQQTVDNYLIYKSQMDAHFRKWLELSGDFSETAKKVMGNLAPFDSLFNQFTTSGKKDTKDPDEKE